MKKYRLTDQRTLLGVVHKLGSATLTDPQSEKKYRLQNPLSVSDINKSVHFTLVPESPPIGKPNTLVSILKENKVEIKIKQVNPYQEDLFQVQEIAIEPLERSAKRANIENIFAENLSFGVTSDVSTILSLHGKTSIINQILTEWQMHLEQFLLNYGYFIKKVNIGFYYAVDTPLMESLSSSKSSYYLRDATKGIFHAEHGFFNPKKLGDQHNRILLDNYLVNNIKSVLISPVFSFSGVLLGYFEISSNMPDLGNQYLQTDLMGAQGLPPLLYFLTSKAEEFVFQMELAYTSQWKPGVARVKIRDISEDGRGIGFYVPANFPLKDLNKGAILSFQISINQVPFTFFGSLRGTKASSSSTDQILGVRVYKCDRPEGLQLLSYYASQLIGSPL